LSGNLTREKQVIPTTNVLVAGTYATSGDYYFELIDNTLGTGAGVIPAPYGGPVAGTVGYIEAETPDNISINALAGAPGMQFISTVGDGMDSINTSATPGGNILDGGYTSSFLTGSAAGTPDIFYVNFFAAIKGNIWTTVVNFHAGDTATLWDYPGQKFDVTWLASEGAPGFAGVTAVFTTEQGTLGAVTFAGITQAQREAGAFTFAYGSTPWQSAQMGTSYVTITSHASPS
jgi:hypothetical protein